MPKFRLNKHIIKCLLAFLLFLSSCDATRSFLQTQTSPIAATASVQGTQVAFTQSEIEFQVEVPIQSPPANLVFLDILDEVTGLAFNTQRYKMEQIDDRHFKLIFPIRQGSLIKYRYSRDDNPISIERTTQGSLVRYRVYYVSNPAIVQDIVSAWDDVPYQGDQGRILGQVFDISRNPLPDILINVGGKTTISAADGSFLIDGLTPGTHNMVASSINGSFQPYQQGALVAASSTTPTIIQLSPTHLVNITFVLTAPQTAITGIPIRIIGNTYSLGNTFSDQEGGVSVLATRAPVLSLLPDGRYFINLALPAGLDLSYKYTQGDGFWNTEHNADGSFRLRELIVPFEDQIIQDTVDSWTVIGMPAVSFQLTVPESTPKSDTISIQFNPFTWTEPLPMWSTGNNRWIYVLNCPLHLLNSIQYRYCRNEQCSITQTVAVEGSLGKFEFTTSALPEMVTDRVIQWSGIQLDESQTTIVGKEVHSKSADFIAGIELLNTYDPSWQPYYASAFRTIKDLGANWVFITPTWQFSSVNPPVLEPVPGKDPLWTDLVQNINQAKQRDLNLAVFPFTSSANDNTWWSEATRDAGWWQSWFDRYRTFLLHFALLAEQQGAGALILGEPGMYPGLPGGKLPDGDSSNVPPDADIRWQQLISDIRSRYDGMLILALKDTENPPQIAGEVDALYILISSPLIADNADVTDLYQAFDAILNEQVHPLVEQYQKPMILGINYPSTDDAALGCIRLDDQCMSFERFDQAVLSSINVPVNLGMQFDIYEAFVSVVNEKDWVQGIVSRGYYVPAALQDASSSIHGKPAAAVLWYWYPRFRGVQ